MFTIKLPPAWRDPRVIAALGGRPEADEPLAGGAASAARFCLEALGWQEDAAGWRPPAAGPGAEAVLADPAVLAEVAGELAALVGRMAPAAAGRLVPMIAVRALARARAQATPPVAGLRKGPGDLQALGVERPYLGFFAVETHRLRHRRFDGAMSAEIERTVFTSGDAVTVLPYDPGCDAVLLIEQFRAGPYARRDPLPWCIEAIAGRCDGAETLEETARREAREEAGLELGRMERVLGYYPTPAIAAEFITSFVAEARLENGEGGVHGLETEHEDIRAFVVPRAEAQAALASGEINNAPLALSLLWLELNAERLRRLWSG